MGFNKYGDRSDLTLTPVDEYNLRSLGVKDAGTSDADLMKEMVVKMVS